MAGLKSSRHRLGILSNVCASHWDYIANGRYGIIPTLFDVTWLQRVTPETSFFLGELMRSPLCGAHFPASALLIRRKRPLAELRMIRVRIRSKGVRRG